ncbi:alpha/beta hydrolase [Halobacterium sp. R2-5]|uniref:alpha/beta fold hydrolase n=1 Tax=Halobacterium sp. R2-5 TaxID=2715751 RepID=UPI0014223561|nr:alpha/beta hydrolase [Halobacterium sp. R2-5]
MHPVVSADGTEIGYETRGDGRPLVLVHGTAGRKESFSRLVPHLAEDFTVVTYDRRGRGDSGDSDDYDFEREVEDLQAVVADLDDDPVVFGHSFGGLTALEAADGMDVDRLILYEPSVLLGEPHGGTLAERIRAHLADGDKVGGVEEFFEAVGAGHLVGGPVVERAAGIAETVAREIEVVETYELGDPETGAPTLLLVGEDGPEHLKKSIRALAERLADTERVELADTGHLGNNTAPEQVADAVRAFVRD